MRLLNVWEASFSPTRLIKYPNKLNIDMPNVLCDS